MAHQDDNSDTETDCIFLNFIGGISDGEDEEDKYKSEEYFEPKPLFDPESWGEVCLSKVVHVSHVSCCASIRQSCSHDTYFDIENIIIKC